MESKRKFLVLRGPSLRFLLSSIAHQLFHFHPRPKIFLCQGVQGNELDREERFIHQDRCSTVLVEVNAAGQQAVHMRNILVEFGIFRCIAEGKRIFSERKLCFSWGFLDQS